MTVRRVATATATERCHVPGAGVLHTLRDRSQAQSILSRAAEPSEPCVHADSSRDDSRFARRGCTCGASVAIIRPQSRAWGGGAGWRRLPIRCVTSEVQCLCFMLICVALWAAPVPSRHGGAAFDRVVSRVDTIREIEGAVMCLGHSARCLSVSRGRRAHCAPPHTRDPRRTLSRRLGRVEWADGRGSPLAEVHVAAAPSLRDLHRWHGLARVHIPVDCARRCGRFRQGKARLRAKSFQPAAAVRVQEGFAGRTVTDL